MIDSTDLGNNQKMKLLKASIPLFLVLSVLTLTLTFLSVPVSSRTATGTYYLDTPLPIASYYVGQYSNNTYFAINGSNWQNFIRSTNASYVFEMVLGNITSGGKVIVGAGKYDISTNSILLDYNKAISIEGEGPNIDVAEYSPTNVGVIIKYTGTGFALDSTWTTGQEDGKLIIKNIVVSLEQWEGQGSGIDISGFDEVTLDHVFVRDPNDLKYAGTYGVYMKQTTGNNILITNCIVQGKDYGFYNDCTPHVVYEHCRVVNSNNGFYTTDASGGADNLNFFYCRTFAVSETSFRIRGHQNILINPFIEECNGTGIALVGGFDYTIIQPRVSTAGFQPTFNLNCSNWSKVTLITKSEEFIEYLKYTGDGLYNYGESEASNDDYIAHGLGGIPNYVFLTVMESNSAYAVQVKATNATHFQLYLYDIVAAGVEVVDQTIVWEAVYQP